MLKLKNGYSISMKPLMATTIPRFQRFHKFIEAVIQNILIDLDVNRTLKRQPIDYYWLGAQASRRVIVFTVNERLDSGYDKIANLGRKHKSNRKTPVLTKSPKSSVSATLAFLYGLLSTDHL